MNPEPLNRKSVATLFAPGIYYAGTRETPPIWPFTNVHGLHFHERNHLSCEIAIDYNHGKGEGRFYVRVGIWNQVLEYWPGEHKWPEMLKTPEKCIFRTPWIHSPGQEGRLGRVGSPENQVGILSLEVALQPDGEEMFGVYLWDPMFEGGTENRWLVPMSETDFWFDDE